MVSFCGRGKNHGINTRSPHLRSGTWKLVWSIGGCFKVTPGDNTTQFLLGQGDNCLELLALNAMFRKEIISDYTFKEFDAMDETASRNTQP